MLRIGIQQRLTFRKRSPLFSKGLLKAFFCALLFHLTLFFTLCIKSPPDPDLFSILLPVAVEIDLGNPSTVFVHPSPVAFTVLERPTLPPLLEIPASLSSDFSSVPHWPEADFSHTERLDYEFLEDLDD